MSDNSDANNSMTSSIYDVSKTPMLTSTKEMLKRAGKGHWKPQIKMGVRSLDLLNPQLSTPFTIKRHIHFAAFTPNNKNCERSYIATKSTHDDSFYSEFLPRNDFNCNESKRYNRQSNSIKALFSMHNASVSKKSSSKSNSRRWTLNFKQQKNKDLDKSLKKDNSGNQNWMVDRIEQYEERCKDLTSNLELALHNGNRERNRRKCYQNQLLLQWELGQDLRVQVESQKTEIEKLHSDVEHLKIVLSATLSKMGYSFDDSFLGLQQGSHATSYLCTDDDSRNSNNTRNTDSSSGAGYSNGVGANHYHHQQQLMDCSGLPANLICNASNSSKLASNSVEVARGFDEALSSGFHYNIPAEKKDRLRMDIFKGTGLLSETLF